MAHIKQTANYRMSSSLKTSLALSSFQDPHKRGEWKRAMIQAELAAAVAPKRESKGRPQGGTAYNTNATGTASTASE